MILKKKKFPCNILYWWVVERTQHIDEKLSPTGSDSLFWPASGIIGDELDDADSSLLTTLPHWTHHRLILGNRDFGKQFPLFFITTDFLLRGMCSAFSSLLHASRVHRSIILSPSIIDRRPASLKLWVMADFGGGSNELSRIPSFLCSIKCHRERDDCFPNDW